MIDINKKYKSRNGQNKVRLYCIIPEQNCIHGAIYLYGKWCINYWDLNGEHAQNLNFSLVEVKPYEDFTIDDKVLVWADGLEKKYKRYFAGICDDGNGLKAVVFKTGTDSWTSTNDGMDDKEIWQHCEKYQDE